MKHIFLLFLVFFTFTPSLLAESSDDAYTVEQACTLSNGLHLGKIVGLFDLYNSIFPDSNYVVGVFHHVTDYTLGDALVFTVNDSSYIGEQRYSKLFLMTCKTENRETNHFKIFEKRPGVQYSPEVAIVNRNYILLTDWENISGKSYQVAQVFDRTKNVFHIVNNDILLKSSALKKFVRNAPFSWTIKSYNVDIITVEVRVGVKMRTFRIKVK